MHQVDNGFSLLAGLLSTFIAFAFDVPAPAIFAAFIGSCFGVAFTEAVTYKRAVFMVIGGTVAAGLLVSFLIKTMAFAGWLPPMEQVTPRGAAALLAFILVKYNKKLLGIIEFQLDRFMGKGVQ